MIGGPSRETACVAPPRLRAGVATGPRRIGRCRLPRRPRTASFSALENLEPRRTREPECKARPRRLTSRSRTFLDHRSIDRPSSDRPRARPRVTPLHLADAGAVGGGRGTTRGRDVARNERREVESLRPPGFWTTFGSKVGAPRHDVQQGYSSTASVILSTSTARSPRMQRLSLSYVHVRSAGHARSQSRRLHEPG